MLEVDHALTFEFKTPHITWAKPYARGKSRVLLFIGGRGTNFREGVELMQRFDIEAEAALYSRIVDSTKDDWHGGKVGIKRIEALLEKEWDVYLFLGIAPANLPEALRQNLIGKVKLGSGVILTGVDDPTLMQKSNVKKDVEPFLKGIAEEKVFILGKGRVVRLPERPKIDYTEGWQNTYETWQENLGRAVQWAAGKEPQNELSFSLSKNILTRIEHVNLYVTWSGAITTGETPRLQMWIRMPIGWIAPWPDLELVSGKTVELALPRLPAGRYHLDGRVFSSAGVENWATIPFEVASVRRISRIHLNSDWDETVGKIAGYVSLSGTADPSEAIRISVLDKDQRILIRKDVVTGGDQANFSFDITPWMPMLVTVGAVIMNGGEMSMSSYSYFHNTRRNLDQFNFLIWSMPNGTLAPYAEESLARSGVTLQLAQGNPPLYVAANSIAWVPYTTSISTKLDAKGIMTPFCWNDVVAVDARIQKLADQHLPSRRHGVFSYSLGDEIATQGACLATTCMEAYRGYLKEAYGTLEALNRSWGTDFGDWEAVGLSDPGDNEEKRSFEGRNYPRWFDRQAFKSWNLVQYTRKYAAAYGAMDPQARTGFEGAGRFDRGDDIDLIVRNLGFWSPYPGTTDEVIRSIAPRDFPRANWMGYTKDADSLLQKYWRMVIRGMDSVWWWRWECIGRFNGWLAPDFRPYPAVKEILADTRPVREGLGDLLLKSRMEDDGIAILYSYPSTFAHRLEEGNTFGEYEKSHATWHKAIRDLGLQFAYVTDRMLRLGEFDAKRFRVLILPRAEAIGEHEAAVIRAFTEAGGTVIADTRPGIYDDHCKRYDKGILDDLFGVKRKAFLRARKVVVATVDPGIEISDGNSIENRGQALNLEVGGRTQFSRLEGVPNLISRKVGKGYAFLINGDLNVLHALGKSGAVRGGVTVQDQFGGESKIQKEDCPALLGVLLDRLAGVRPAMRLKRADGGPVRDVEVIRWRNGDNEILSLFRQGGKGETVTVDLSRTAQVYDLRNRNTMGELKTFRTAILPNRASFFVLTPMPAPPVLVKIDSEKLGVVPASPAAVVKEKGQVPAAYAPGTLMKVRLSVPGARGDHAVLVKARFPKPPVEPPRSGAFFPRTGYPVMPAEFSPTLRQAASPVTLRQAQGDTTIPFVYPGVDSEKGEFLKRVEILGREPVTVDVPIAYNDPPGTYELTVTDLFTQKTVTRSWRVQ